MKDCEKMRNEARESESERAPRSGADYWCRWCSHRFHEANIKATAGRGGRADSSRKGMRNAICVMEEERGNDCVSVWTFPLGSPPTCPAATLTLKEMVPANWRGLMFYTAASLKPRDEFRGPL
ncbi:unnamed protein product [Pleuronectes platessa]|uniref:Uncharacterized protein n=1 Tax=Pleuronectes platessa TaxID=8262 RepID=A0A9N7YXI8_PLEPL|nr:unnamed protein product [Pleuronectes platessa]